MEPSVKKSTEERFVQITKNFLSAVTHLALPVAAMTCVYYKAKDPSGFTPPSAK